MDKRVEIVETNTHMLVVLNRAQRLAEHVIFMSKQIILQNSVPKRETIMAKERQNLSMKLMTLNMMNMYS